MTLVPITGGDGDDLLLGCEGDDELSGLGGNDSLYGIGGNDILDGGSGNDYLDGGAGDDHLDGGEGADRMEGGPGDDSYWLDDAGDEVAESLDAGTDTVYSSVDYTLLGSQENLTLIGSNPVNGTGNSQDNVIVGNDGDNTLSGGNGDDTLEGGLGTDTLIGGDGNDTYIIDSLIDQIIDSSGMEDTVRSSISYQLDAGNSLENLVLTGGDDIDGAGNSDDNSLTGNGGSNTLSGLGGDDSLDGGDGADTMIGGAGDDIYVVDDAADVVTELDGEGKDTVQSSISYVLPAHVEHLLLTGGDAIDGTGNELNNILTGNDAGNLLDGGEGSDELYGGGGDDVYYVDDGGDLVVEAPGGGDDTVQSSINHSLGLEVENLVLVEGSEALNGNGNDSDNTLVGNSAGNDLDGKDGDDYIDGGAGADDMSGGYGDDIYIVDNAGDTVSDRDKKNIGTEAEPVYVDGGMDTVYSSVSFELSAFVESLVLTGTDSIDGTGNGRSNTLVGNSASNTLTGDDGDDYLDGGAGLDILIGGKGNDTLVVDDVGDAVVELDGQGTDTIVSSFSYELAGTLENLTLGGTDDITGTGNSGDNILTGNAGINTLVGKQGDDSYYVQNGADMAVELAGEGTDTVFSTVNYALGANVENLALIGGDAINGTGNSLDNTLSGNGAANVLDGGMGNDTLIGGAGDDTYVIDSTGDKITELEGGGTDTVQTAMAYTLGESLENLVLTGTSDVNGTGNASNNELTGNDGENTLTGGEGNDTLKGGGDADILKGGIGDDTYVIDDLSDTLSEGKNAGIDTVKSSISHTLGKNFENLTLTGASPVSGTGNKHDNTVIGNDANNTLSGLKGNDTLDGSGGADTLSGGAGNDLYVVDNAGDSVTEGARAGTDTVQSSIDYTLGANVENLTLTGSDSIDGTGNALNNIITGNAGNNVLDGAGGSDKYYGGDGDDTFIIDSSNDAAYEDVESGNDTVLSSITYSLEANVENLVLTGSSDIHGTGNDLDNLLTGNAAGNTLNGGAGNDTLDGGAGADLLKGGMGDDVYLVDASDTILEDSAAGTDTVKSSFSHTLVSNLENLVLEGGAAIDGTGNSRDNTLTGNDAANTLSGLEGDDILIGGGGADTLAGGNGLDIFVFDSLDAADTVNDFVSGVDLLAFDGDTFTSLSGSVLCHVNFVAGDTALDANDFVMYDSGTGTLYYDADANGAGSAVIVAQMGAGTALDYTDIVIS